MEIKLASLGVGERGTVTRLQLAPEQAHGLTRLGLLPGTEIVCLRRSPLGDPAAYRFRSTTLALRDGDAEQILVVRGE